MFIIRIAFTLIICNIEFRASAASILEIQEIEILFTKIKILFWHFKLQRIEKSGFNFLGTANGLP